MLLVPIGFEGGMPQQRKLPPMIKLFNDCFVFKVHQLVIVFTVEEMLISPGFPILKKGEISGGSVMFTQMFGHFSPGL